jgi:Tol biopolymer transport system component
MRKQLPVPRRRAKLRRRSSTHSAAHATHSRLLRYEIFEDRRMLSVDLVSKAAFPSFSAGGGPSSVVSANGRYVAFVDAATLTGISTTLGVQNIYRFDRLTGDVLLVSVNSAGTGSGNRDSLNPVISADGSVVAFSSIASNLNPLDTNTMSDIFARDLNTGTTYLVSISLTGTGSGNGVSDNPVIRADGNVVAFRSNATNLHPFDTSTSSDIFARNLSTGTTYLVSVNSAGTGSGGSSDIPVISADGNVVAFRSSARNLSSLKTSIFYDIFARNLTTNTTRLVSINSAGTSSGNEDSDSPVLSADGSVVAFRSDASNLVSADSNGFSDVFARNLLTRSTRLVSVNSAGTASGNGVSDSPAMSGGGTIVAFRSSAKGLYALNANNKYEVYARNLVSGTTQLVSLNSSGVRGNFGVVDGPAISADGSVVVFSSDSKNLNPLDTNAYTDVFATNLASGTTRMSFRHYIMSENVPHNGRLLVFSGFDELLGLSTLARACRRRRLAAENIGIITGQLGNRSIQVDLRRYHPLGRSGRAFGHIWAARCAAWIDGERIAFILFCCAKPRSRRRIGPKSVSYDHRTFGNTCGRVTTKSAALAAKIDAYPQRIRRRGFNLES